MKVTKNQLRQIIREEYTRLKIRRIVRESLDDLPPGQYSLSGMPGHSGVDKDDLAHGRGDYAPSHHKPDVDTRMLDSIIYNMIKEDMTPGEFLNYFGNQDGYMFHGKNWPNVKPAYKQALQIAYKLSQAGETDMNSIMMQVIDSMPDTKTATYRPPEIK